MIFSLKIGNSNIKIRRWTYYHYSLQSIGIDYCMSPEDFNKFRFRSTGKINSILAYEHGYDPPVICIIYNKYRDFSHLKFKWTSPS